MPEKDKDLFSAFPEQYGLLKHMSVCGSKSVTEFFCLGKLKLKYQCTVFKLHITSRNLMFSYLSKLYHRFLETKKLRSFFKSRDYVFSLSVKAHVSYLYSSSHITTNSLGW